MLDLSIACRKRSSAVYWTERPDHTEEYPDLNSTGYFFVFRISYLTFFDDSRGNENIDLCRTELFDNVTLEKSVEHFEKVISIPNLVARCHHTIGKVWFRSGDIVDFQARVLRRYRSGVEIR